MIGIFLLELDLQCRLARHAYDRLEAAAKHWLPPLGTATSDLSRGSPIEVLSECASFLSATAMISKLLFEGSRKGRTAERCANLRKLLGIDQLTQLGSTTVRNALEHFDERLDTHVPDTTKNSLSLSIHLPVDDPKKDALCLRRLDPRSLVLTLVDTDLDLRACIAEVDSIPPFIGPIFERMKTEHLILYPSETSSTTP
jgi:hypothetical protein